MSITIKDVAAKAGVTPTVVSRVLHNRALAIRVSENTAERVRLAAIELGYQVNVTARQFRNGQTSVIGVLHGIGFPRLRFNNGSRYFAALMDGIIDGAFEHGYSVSMCPELLGENPLDSLSDGRFDGFVWYSSSPSVYNRVFETFTGPLVVIHTPSSDFGCRIPTVICDNDQGIGLAIDHLMELGHRKIAFSHFSGDRFGEAALRRFSFGRHMARHGLDVDDADCIDARPEGAGVREYFANGLRHTAVVCVNDTVAADYLHRSREFGVRVPEDFSVIGFDSTSFCEELTPRLTSVFQPLELMGRRAVDLLVRRISHEADIPSLVIPCSLDVRDSTLSIGHKEKSL